MHRDNAADMSIDEPAVVVASGDDLPTQLLLGGDVGLAGLALGVEGVEGLVEALASRLTRVDGTADDRVEAGGRRL